MEVYQAIIERRTIRKYQQKAIATQDLEKMVYAATLAPSGANMQPLKYVIVAEANQVAQVFEQVKWAGYIAPEGNPKQGEEPVAYIGILVDTQIKKAGYELDAGAACQNIMLTAKEMGVGSCWLGSINREKIGEILDLPEHLLLNTMITLGYPMEDPMIEDSVDGIKYYKDEAGRLHVPKRTLDEVLLKGK